MNKVGLDASHQRGMLRVISQMQRVRRQFKKFGWRVRAASLAIFIGIPCSDLSSETKVRSALSGEWHLVEFKEPHPQVYALRADDLTRPNQEHLLTEFPARLGHPDGPEVFFLSRVVVKAKKNLNHQQISQKHYLQVDRALTDRLAIFRAVTPFLAIQAAIALNQDAETEAAYPLVRRPFKRHSRFQAKTNDTYIDQAWHIDNRDAAGQPAGVDLKLRGAWSLSDGSGVTVAFSDNGMDIAHPDLASRASEGPHFNFGDNIASGNFINSDAHGTAVAGLIAAEGNNDTGVIGVAPKANLSSLVVFDINRRGREGIVTDDALMDMFEFEIDTIDIQNHSWGSVAEQQSGIDALSDRGIEAAVSQGREGRGVVMFRAGGNEREFLSNANDDGFSSDPRVILVGATRLDGNYASYSTPGACVLISAPSGDTLFPGVATTDHAGAEGYVSRGRADIEDYLLGDAGFAGTSASSPIAAGVGALMLSRNPLLTYRDVQQILIHASTHRGDLDPDVRENGAGFQVSHNTGYGLPDAAYAVELAGHWKNRPEAVEVVQTTRPNRLIPDRGLYLEILGNNVPAALRRISVRPGQGPFPENGTPAFPLLFQGEATAPISMDLTGRSALIRRGQNTFEEKVRHASEAGAEFAIIFNHQDQTEPPTLGGTDVNAIPVVGITQEDGETLLDYLGRSTNAQAQLNVDSATVEFDVTESLITEHVGLQINTTHSYRGDLRITLTSPSGTTSVLQAYNLDFSRGPRDWTYWSTQHFYETSVGTWTLKVTDQALEDTGSITSASLILRGVPILDIDHDGLDDNWERRAFGSLTFGPKADPDDDGINNAREQILDSNPSRSNRPLRLEISPWDESHVRLSWPSHPGESYDLITSPAGAQAENLIETIAGRFPESEIVLPTQENRVELYRLQRAR